ncbi:hypothetical protein [Paenibacillus agricola]|uniref:Uncharacterized protein n=1 Tax=Paenibacillus agricola TaxID=2716264 RepID=A0ABX0JIE6_9BACL|nr:hypothetical protein [Paenibacillus agricola]NHN34752.1 hypothetical protein [Paenibacillus agricola]
MNEADPRCGLFFIKVTGRLVPIYGAIKPIIFILFKGLIMKVVRATKDDLNDATASYLQVTVA